MEENYKATGLERVEIAEETTYKTGAQHLLIINDSTIIKYWYQDCLDENPELLLFYPGKWRLIKQMFPYLAFKTSAMRIVQLTDLHLPPTGIKTELGIDTRRNFLDMLPRAVALQPDLIVLSGDLCYDTADTPTYTWVRAQMDALGLRYTVIAGNHDDSSLLGTAFGLLVQQKEVYFTQQVDHHTILFLDSAVATISDGQLAWLEEQLSTLKGPVLLFMHHPPFPVGMPFMDDTWPFHRSEDLMAVLARHATPVYVFCGHYHTERVAYVGNVCVHITPSLYFQLDSESAQPAVEHTRIALRTIDFEGRGLATAVKYFEGNHHNT